MDWRWNLGEQKTTENIKQLIANREEEKICAYGTSIGATVFTYQFGLTEEIGAFFDDDSLRQGRYSPGIGAPVLATESPRTKTNINACIISYFFQVFLL